MKTNQTKTKLLATACKLCPFCIAARRWPSSAYARMMKKMENNCKFCKAYQRLKSKQEG